MAIAGAMLMGACAGRPDKAIGRPVALMVMGDSLSAAHGMDPEQGWVALLEMQWKQEGFLAADQRVVNESRSGETTSGGRARLASLLDHHRPSHLFIELGANDALRRVPASETVSNMASMVGMARERGIKVAVARVDIPTSWRFVGGSVIDEVIDQVQSQGGVEVVDFPLDEAASGDGMMMADNIHPSSHAQPMLAQRMGAALARFAGTP